MDEKFKILSDAAEQADLDVSQFGDWIVTQMKEHYGKHNYQELKDKINWEL